MSRYKAKICPTCGTEHKKRGPYCSRSCGNSREYTQQQRRELSVKVRNHFNTDAGREQATAAKDAITVAKIKQKNKHDPDAAELTLEDFFLEPVVKDLPDGKFVQDGDVWTEDGW